MRCRPTVCLLLGLSCMCQCTRVDGGADDDRELERFRIVVLADPHVPDPNYEGPEANELDTESILAAHQRLLDARARINAMDPAPDFVVILGDLLHTHYPYDEVQDYYDQPSAFSVAAELLDGFEVPVHLVFGEHDYGVPRIPREDSHVLFAHFFDAAPHTAFEHHGWKFILANSQLGATWDASSDDYDPARGSYGREQLDWIADHLFDRMPTVFLSHFPIPFDTAVFENLESPSRDIFTLMTDHADTMQLALGGHLHRWVDYRIVAPTDVFVVAGLRYDADNFWVIEFDPASQTYEILDIDKVHWQTPFSDTATE
ncbi:metallophosphoesterase family protein [Enhygromyxa salina]|uniref:3',5'-cyclic adenosine monophosphate phosphodiesterase CpdA n=1 Tax=Enhygromyxa salina TaxID=215803 RepID=A0A2S9Y844_9BACT|nr:metallophosphoesterase [Enhygromyxa salina]PRQ01269.1 3',5'-cyclic adenosine monophosphate phosphodiesterase CpdA [Enhygromyxa salina]